MRLPWSVTSKNINFVFSSINISFRFKKDFIFDGPLVCKQPAPDVVVSKFSVEYYHMDVSDKSLDCLKILSEINFISF